MAVPTPDTPKPSARFSALAIIASVITIIPFGYTALFFLYVAAGSNKSAMAMQDAGTLGIGLVLLLLGFGLSVAALVHDRKKRFNQKILAIITLVLNLIMIMMLGALFLLIYSMG